MCRRLWWISDISCEIVWFHINQSCVTEIALCKYMDLDITISNWTLVIHKYVDPGNTVMHCFAGVLLHGPPGCGKTMLAKATAKAAGARFINLQASVLFDKWYGESQKRAEAIFSLVSRL